jgi:hypothetical protein
MFGLARTEPEPHAIEEVKTRKVDEFSSDWLALRSEEDRGGEDPLKSTYQAPVVRAVFGQAEEVKYLGC